MYNNDNQRFARVAASVPYTVYWVPMAIARNFDVKNNNDKTAYSGHGLFLKFSIRACTTFERFCRVRTDSGEGHT